MMRTAGAARTPRPRARAIRRFQTSSVKPTPLAERFGPPLPLWPRLQILLPIAEAAAVYRPVQRRGTTQGTGQPRHESVPRPSAIAQLMILPAEPTYVG